MILLLFTARGSVCVCGHQDDREHHARYTAPSLHVCLHWGATVPWKILFL